MLTVGMPDDESEATQVEVEARRQGCRLGVEVRYRDENGTAEQTLGESIDDSAGFVLRLMAERADIYPDAWEVLEADSRDESTTWRLSLDHVMTTVPFTSQPFTSQPFTSQPFTSQPFTSQPFTSQPFTSQPFTSQPFTSQPFTSQPFTSQLALSEYAVPGRGGRAPVQWLASRPHRESSDGGPTLPGGVARPVVAIVDSGIGSHEWFGTYALDPAETDGAGVVLRDASLPDGPIGTFPVPEFPEEDAEIGGISTSRLTGPLDPIAGHGTFIAGVVHQKCPDALLLPVRVVGGPGVAIESEVIESLRRLYRYHQLGLAGEEGFHPVDVVVLSMGYYHEDPDDLQWDHPLSAVLAQLREAGVAVVAAAGNDGETRPMYPAAFAPEVDRRGAVPRIVCRHDVSSERPPILTVGALNPDGTTALFSNDGPWVTCLRPGAALVSSIPTTLDGPITPSVRLKEKHTDGYRTTVDPEGFQGGYATWSGTSFAAPVLAGEIASALIDVRRARAAQEPASLGDKRRDDAAAHVSERVRDVWRAITSATNGLTLEESDHPS
ncbi:S8 family serine peptidase [Isoptericola sp. F-RaC21]|uniref:S8 family serine peptidase n=1 Tax=Isoptericola sp. F-RaC21 TaxID=3141452 RepID=UPI00315BB183